MLYSWLSGSLVGSWKRSVANICASFVISLKSCVSVPSSRSISCIGLSVCVSEALAFLR